MDELNTSRKIFNNTYYWDILSWEQKGKSLKTQRGPGANPTNKGRENLHRIMYRKEENNPRNLPYMPRL